VIDFYKDETRACFYLIYQNDSWEIVEEGKEIPTKQIEVQEIDCRRCKNEMIYNDEEREMFCPSCERKFDSLVPKYDDG
jgi:uncharacterized CHY-type Zn-finger protein